MIAHEVECAQQLVVIERQNVIADVIGLQERVLILQNTISVQLYPLDASSEKALPLLPKLERVEIIA